MTNVWKTVVALALAIPGLAMAQGMSLEQIATLKQAGSAAISPDGSRIAYIRSVPRDIPDEEDGPAWRELHVIGDDGRSRPFITGQASVGGMEWHPDGDRIVFLDKRGDAETTRLYSISVDGGEATELVALETDIAGYSFSPDGAKVAVLAFEPVDAEHEELEEQGFSQVVYEEGLRDRRIYVLDLENPHEAPRMIALDGSIQDAEWSPAGDRMAVKITPRQLVDDTLVFTRIRIIDVEGEEIGRIDNPGKLGAMAWSPDGEHLAFIGTNVVNDAAAGRLMVAGNAGGDFEDLLPALPGHVQNLGWLDDDRIAFLSAEGTAVRLGAIDADGDDQRTLLEDGPVLSGLSISADGDIALTGSTPEHPSEVFRFDGGAVERLTDSNPWLAEVELARQEVVRYTARDGLEIEGVLVYPLDYSEDRRYPLILNVHGGPEAHYSNGWLTSYASPAQHAAAEGYFTFFQNYRGSTGRGVEFSQSSFGRPAMEEFDDLVDGVDYLIEQGMADGDRVGITGGSYGGYATAWGATQYSERFAAAVMNVGLSNQIAAFGTSDIPWEFNLVHLGKWPWEDWDLFQQASPLYHVEKAQTPILILHGDADPRVDPTQSRMFYRFLKLQDDAPPVRLVLYPGEGHGNRRAASRYDYSLRLMRWMNHYLKGEGGEPPPYRIEYELEGLADND
ncbi:MAG: S9 family peptidase [Wenzhouxiangellaceae bacterium]|nr:S9 family peptidase [Wenzhouxiangellaceae bacterium]MBS3824328.1 S9 family peptidase [Wenzhouxiangellaceae bacterium]